MERRAVHAVVLNDFTYAENKENITLTKDDVVDVLSRPGPCDGPDPSLMFKFKSRVGYIPSSYLSGQVRLPPGGRLGRIVRCQTQEESTGRDDILHVQADDIIVMSKIPPAEDWWLGEIIHSKNHPENFSLKGAFRPKVVKILAVHPHTTVEHAPLSSSQGTAGGGLMGSNALSPRGHLQKQPLPSASSPPLADSMFSVAAVDDNHIVVLQEELLQYLLAKDMLLFSWLCEVVDGAHTAPLAQAVVHLFKMNGFIPQLINTVIEIEVKRTHQPSTFFRDNTLTSHVVSTYSHDIGKDYILLVLKGLIRSTASYSAETLEINPHMINLSVTTLEENISKLSSVIQLYLDVITASAAHPPPVLTKFPESKYSAIGGFFFLRFLCPAIVSPESYGLVDSGAATLTGANRRPLILVSKVLQSIANGVQFGKKEPYMIPMNELMQVNIAKVHNFFDDLADIAGLEDQFVMGNLGQRELTFRPDQLAKVHAELHLRFGVIKAHVLETVEQSTESGKHKVGMLDALEKLLSKLGLPKPVEVETVAEEEVTSPNLRPPPVHLPQQKKTFFRTSSRDSSSLRRKEKVELEKGRSKNSITEEAGKAPASPKLPPKRNTPLTDDEVPVSHPASTHAGWMLLKGNPQNTLKLRNKWKRFYFLLVEWELHYYKPGDTVKKMGTIDISTATVSQNLAALWAPPSIPKAPNKPGQFQFELAFPDRPVLHFSLTPSASQLDLERWMDAINKAKDSAVGRLPPVLSPRGVLPSGANSITPPPLTLSLFNLQTSNEFQPDVDCDPTTTAQQQHLSEIERTLSPVGSPRSAGYFNFNTFNTFHTSGPDEPETETGGGSAIVGRVRIAHSPSMRVGGSTPAAETVEQRKKAKTASWGKMEMFERLIKGADDKMQQQQQQHQQRERIARRESEKVRTTTPAAPAAPAAPSTSPARAQLKWRAAAVKPPPPPSPTTPPKLSNSANIANNTSPPSGGTSRIGLMPARPDEGDYASIVRMLSKLTQSVERRLDVDRALLGRRNSDGSLTAGAGEAREILESRLSALTAALATLKTIKL
ncbi:PH domain containing protein [Acanthamoeba castellanii str. Neff]|uniref:PH domain containing protein n=1 Tax=Acanthamoeba castellanii (strain ATCC 30010 / Neff) TaxID=1257118 RepID=L8GTH1_ACACF|nr:PH domain containing protein [Acanthamoeba castellanii str. Neff]ELR15903.1 PH domain containing protein [Acanthamoeba castellanii str. Neff]